MKQKEILSTSLPSDSILQMLAMEYDGNTHIIRSIGNDHNNNDNDDEIERKKRDTK